MDLQQWIADDHASSLSRFESAIGHRVPANRWKDSTAADQGGATSSIAWLLFHATMHQDLALNTAVRDHAPMLADHREALGLNNLPVWVGLTEAEDHAVTDVLDLAALRTYVAVVNAATQAWIDKLSIMALDSIPTSSYRLEHHAGIPADGALSWLHTMWADKPVSWLLQWECIGHGHAHVGEMIAVRNRLGFSPF